MQEFGEVTRKESAEFVSVKLPGHKKAVRLRGTLFTQDFDAAVFFPDGHPNSPAYGHLKLPHLN